VVFTAGSIRPARGLEDLVRALPLLEPDLQVVIAGAVDRGAEQYAAAVRRLADRSGRPSQVTWAGQLTEDQMRAAFASAAVFVMTSRAEACPNTVLEAMSAGCPSVSVDLAPMPEFFTDAALYYPAGDAPQLARQVGRVLGDAGQRQRLGALATARAGEFTWESTRDRTIAELQGAIS
jgi:glycosyltransferase involved in cell wall biosynthesis